MTYRSGLLFIPCLILQGVAEPSKHTVLSGTCTEGGCGTSLLMRGTNSVLQPVALVEDSVQTEQKRNQRRLKTDATLAEVQALAEKVMRGEQKVSNITQASLNMIRELMENIVNDTALEHAEDQAEVNQAYASIGACTTKAQTDLTTVGNTNSVVGGDRTAHNDCRDTEVVHLTDKTEKCNEFQDYAAGLEPPACSAAFPPGPSDATWECIMAMALWSTTHNVTYPIKQSACSTATTVHSSTKDSCDNKQGTFESAFCTYAELLNKTCVDQTWCRNTTINARDTTHSRVQISEAARAAEYKSAKHVMCYLDVFNATEEQMPGIFAACHGSTYNTSHLVINYPSTPDEHPCDASPATHVPCDADWLEDEYEANNAWYNVAKENRYTSTTEYVLPTDCAMCAWKTTAAAVASNSIQIGCGACLQADNSFPYYKFVTDPNVSPETCESLCSNTQECVGFDTRATQNLCTIYTEDGGGLPTSSERKGDANSDCGSDWTCYSYQ